MLLKPSEIRYTQHKIRGRFQNRYCCHHPYIGDLVDSIVAGDTKISSIQKITVVLHNGNYYSLDNRRLWVFKQVEERGYCSEIEVGVSQEYLEGNSKFSTTTEGKTISVRGQVRKTL
uniref:Uncharacterized protein n=1 Tax=Octopus bimaculoides TaxID=37653 RepID=A0A0L8HH82_OCTBM